MAMPGTLIKNELNERKISQKNFANAVGMSQSHLSDILSGRRRITKSFAMKTEQFLQIPAVSLLGVQIANDIEKEKRPAVRTEKKIQMLDLFEGVDSVLCTNLIPKEIDYKDIYEMLSLRLKYTQQTQFDAKSFVDEFLGGMDCPNLSGIEERIIATWAVIARTKGVRMKPKGVFDMTTKSELSEKVSKILHRNVDTISRLHSLLSSYGIVFMIVDNLDKETIDSYSYFNEGVPYIVLTCRYDRIDDLSINVFRELGNIFFGNTNCENSAIKVETNGNRECEMPLTEIDKYIRNALIPDNIWNFAPKVSLKPECIKEKYTEWAKEEGFNPWIVLARLSEETGMYKFKSDKSRKIGKGKEVCHDLIA